MDVGVHKCRLTPDLGLDAELDACYHCLKINVERMPLESFEIIKAVSTNKLKDHPDSIRVVLLPHELLEEGIEASTMAKWGLNEKSFG